MKITEETRTKGGSRYFPGRCHSESPAACHNGSPLPAHVSHAGWGSWRHLQSQAPPGEAVDQAQHAHSCRPPAVTSLAKLIDHSWFGAVSIGRGCRTSFQPLAPRSLRLQAQLATHPLYTFLSFIMMASRCSSTCEKRAVRARTPRALPLQRRTSTSVWAEDSENIRFTIIALNFVVAMSCAPKKLRTVWGPRTRAHRRLRHCPPAPALRSLIRGSANNEAAPHTRSRTRRVAGR
jgi:hypothetical protein